MSQSFENFGKYILLEKIQTGGMAEIYLARKPGASGVSKFIAIKRILPQFSEQTEFIEMFKDEAKIAVNLSHANIVSIHEFGVEKNQFFLAMDYVEGRNLRQILNKMKKSGVSFSIEQVLFVIKEVAAGLDHAHRCIDANTGKPLNIIHRDMSPQNVMVSFEGEVKVVDFGIAKAETQIDSTRAGTLKGKFGYMSPEQAEGQNVDLRTDIFALGIVLWELLASDRLFVANNEINTLRKVRDCQIPSLRKINPNIPGELERIVSKALAKDRNLRYQTAAAFQRELSRFLNRQFPDFSQHDFSVFIKTLFAAEILESRKKMVEFSRFELRNPPPAQVAPRAQTPTSSSAQPRRTMEQTNPTQTENTAAPPRKEPTKTQSKRPAPATASRAPSQQQRPSELTVDRSNYFDRTGQRETFAGTYTGGTYYGTRSFSKPRPKRYLSGALMPIGLVVVALIAGLYMFSPSNAKRLVALASQAINSSSTSSSSMAPGPDQLELKKEPTFDINVTSSPSGANILIDDKPISDTTPTSFKLKQFADVKITIKKDGFTAWEQRMKIDTNMNLKVSLPAERTAKLDINVIGAGEIFVDNVKVASSSPAYDITVPAERDITVRAIDPMTGARDELHLHLPERASRKITLIPRAFKKPDSAQKQ